MTTSIALITFDHYYSIQALYFLFFFFFRTLEVHVGKKKQRRPERTRGQVARAAVVSFPNARGDRASEWANERVWDEQNHFASLISFAKGRGERGREFTSFVPN